MCGCIPGSFAPSGWPVSEIGYGLWGMGGWTGSNDDESMAALERAVALGCTFFDTALAYGKGKSEQLLGRVLADHRDKRLIVATKIPPENMRWPALPSTRSMTCSPPITFADRPRRA